MADQDEGGGEVRRARDRRGDRQLVAEAGALLASALDVNETLGGLVRLLVPRVADWCAIRMTAADGTPELVALAHDDPAALARAREIEARSPPSPSERTVLGEVLRTGRSVLRPVVTDAMLVESARSSQYLADTRALGLRSSMLVALTARGRTFGVIAMATTASSGRRLDEHDLALAEELAAHAALAIDNARLVAEVERAARLVEEAAERVETLAEASSVLASALDDDAALRALADFAVRSLADWAVTYTYRDGRIRRVGLAHRDPDERPRLEALVDAAPPSLRDRCGAGAVIREGKPLFVPDVGAEVRGAPSGEDARPSVDLGARSSIVVPLRARGRSIGALTLAATGASGRRYTKMDLALVEKLAADAALIIDNARLLRQAQEAVRARDEMVAAVSHDLRSPLHVIRNGVALLEGGGVGGQAATIRAIAHSAEQMERFAVGLLDVARLEDGAYRLDRAKVEGRALLRDAARLVAPLATPKGIELIVELGEEPAIVDADADAIRRALGNVLGNAVKFTPARGHVRAAVRREGEHVRFRVEDSGPGIGPAELPRLFDRFWRGPRSTGTGLGLAIAKGLVDAHGGEIRVESTPGHGATFEIVLPAVRS